MNRRLLLIDSDRESRASLSESLAQAGFQVTLAGSGAEGLRFALAVPPAVIVLDLSLSDGDGFDLCRELRQHPRTMQIPFLIASRRADEIDRILGFELGADDYLTKPFAFAELLIRIKALLRRGAVPRTNTIQVGDLEIDRLTHQVRRGGAAIRLTSKEYALLEYFASNAGRILSRTMIIEHVWDQSFEGLTNIVDVYVRQLRSKIDEPFAASARLLHTIRNAGYCLSEKEEF